MTSTVLESSAVFCQTATEPSYRLRPELQFPDLPHWARKSTALAAVRALLAHAGLDRPNVGSPSWNPLGAIIRKGSQVLIKPNWVYHDHSGGHGLECLVTHTTVIEAILHYAAKAQPERIVVGDAPLQGCDFDALMRAGRVHEMVAQFVTNGVNVSVQDFRRTIQPQSTLGVAAAKDCRPLDDFILYDLGRGSLLEPITKQDSEFRVTMYDPDLLKRTHRPGQHQYLIAREAIEADVVINVPKLKTHKKACVTGALKNFVGINGHKEYLPHHRKGGSEDGGDCYPGSSKVKMVVEDLLDATNRAQGSLPRRMLASTTRIGMGVGKVLGVGGDYEGSWFGNDTVWRTSLDLLRIVRYGRVDGTLATTPQRTVLTLTDAIIAGEGEGPLSPTPVALGLLTLGISPPAVEWVNSVLMGLEPQHIPIVREAFAQHAHPLATVSPDAISVLVDGEHVPMTRLFARRGRAFRLPEGWREYASAPTSQT
jgi:uncharacterized protein (DUF362 family)